jgi:hypothetical protein
MMRRLHRHSVTSLFVVLILCGFGSSGRAQDNSGGGEPIVPSIVPSALTYDYLVDGNLAQDDPVNKKYKTLQAAVAAAPAGTSTRQTVIGIMPNVYYLPGTPTSEGITISKNYITLLGITNNRRSVVIAGNRGNKQGGGSDTTSYNGMVVIVSATGFRAENLTFLNYCNVDYEYPGDPSKNLTKRSDVITQAVALQAGGDKHVYINVAFLSRLDTTFLSLTRSYFKNVFIEGTDDFIGGGTISVWEDSQVLFPTGNGVPSTTGIVFINTRFTSAGGMQFYKADYGASSVALINCVMPVQVPGTPVAWARGTAPARLNAYSLTYHTRDANGNPAVIFDGTIGTPTFNNSRELSDEEALAFNPWNLLRGTDNWDPAGVGPYYEALGQGSLPYQMALVGANPSIRTGAAGATISASVVPSRVADKTVRWSTDSDLITLSTGTGPSVVVTGNNKTENPAYVAVKAMASNGFYGTAWVYVEPVYIAAPTFIQPPTLDPPAGGQVHVSYLLDMGPTRQDQSLVSWYLCDDAACASQRAIAVSRGNLPLRYFTLTAGTVGKYLGVSVQPKHDISDPGVAQSTIATAPIKASDVTSTTESPNFRNFVTTPNASYVSGLWTVLGSWTSSVGSDLVNGYGVRVASQGASLLYQRDEAFGDMRVRLVMRPEKTAGQGFGSAGSGLDDAPPTYRQKSDVYVKYDPRTKNGYALRFWRTTASASMVMFQWYQIVAGVGSPLSGEQVLTGVFKPTTFLDIKAIGNTLSATAYNTTDGQLLSLSATAAPNQFGGAGVYWSGTVPPGNSNVYSMIEVSYPESTWSLTLSGTAVGANLPAGARIGTLRTADSDDTFTYTLVAGEGSSGNDAFTITGDQLRTSRPLEPGGAYAVRVRSTNQDGFFVERSFTISVVSVGFAVTPTALWPPNGRTVPVRVSGRFSPDAGGIEPGSVRYVVTDSYGEVQPTAGITLATDGSFTASIPLVASRLGTDRNGREYRIVISGVDTGGNPVTSSAVVMVPHDQR